MTQGRTLLRKKDYQAAGQLFMKVASARRPEKMGQAVFDRIRRSAALLAVDAFGLHLMPPGLKPPRTHAGEPMTCVRKQGARCLQWKAPIVCQAMPVKPDAEALIRAIEASIALDPKSMRVARHLLTKAEILVAFGRCDDAVALLEEVVSKHLVKDLRTARRSAHLALDMLDVLKSRKTAQRVVPAFFKVKLLMGEPALRARVESGMMEIEWQKGERLQRAGLFKECGDQYLKAALLLPRSAKAHEMLWNASVCYSNGKYLDKAIETRDRLIRSYPRSSLAARALYFNGGDLHWMGAFEEAARYYERFAFSNPKDEAAPKALVWAARIRYGTGNQRKVLEDIGFFMRSFAARKPRKAAELAFMIYSMHARAKNMFAAASALERFLKAHKKAAAPPALRAEAMVRLAEIYWARSCRVQPVFGLCGRQVIQKPPADANPADAKKKESKLQRVRLVLVPRNTALASKAEALLGQAAGIRSTGTSYWRGKARFLLADMKVEEFLKRPVPRNLDFDPRQPEVAKKSVKLFKHWVEERVKELTRLKKEYEEVVKSKSIGLAVASLTRIGMLFMYFGQNLMGTPAPRNLKTTEQKMAYRDQLAALADPLLTSASTTFLMCGKAARKHAYYGAWLSACQQLGRALDPVRFPLTGELVAQPDLPSPCCMAPKVMFQALR